MTVNQNTPHRFKRCKPALRLSALFAGTAAILAACSAKPNAQDDFMENLAELCGNAYSAKVISTDAVDSIWRASDIIIGPVNCSGGAFKFPLTVGDNRAQSWVLSAKAGGLSLKHVNKQHAHSDGSIDPINNYGGQTQNMGTAYRQDFPADTFSRKLFEGQGLPNSAKNIWAMDINPGKALGYEMSRFPTEAQKAAGEKGRYFRMEIDITQPLAASALLSKAPQDED